MPWQKADAPRHDKKADTLQKKSQWAAVANSVLKQTGDEGRAVRAANGVIGRSKKK